MNEGLYNATKILFKNASRNSILIARRRVDISGTFSFPHRHWFLNFLSWTVDLTALEKLPA
jgi:hypothetical protein